MAKENPIQTLVIDNFQGSMTPYIDGDINSGLTNVVEVFGHDPFVKPGNLTWYEDATQIDAGGSVITDLILAGKTRVESGILYNYCIGHTGRLYKIQVNDPTTYDPNFDTPTLLATLTTQTPTFTRGAFIDFFGSTEKIYIGHDKGVTSINFNGTGESFVGTLGSWTQNVPRPLTQFLGNLYAGNGTNIAEVISAGTVSSYTKLNPGFPSGTQVRDIDVTPDGSYLHMVVTELALGDITTTSTPTPIIAASDSFVFKWNGTDTGYTSFITYPGVTLSANALFGPNQYVFGYDFRGGGIYSPERKLLTSSQTTAFAESPNPNSVFGAGNMIYWATSLPFEGVLESLITMYGTPSEFEIKGGYWAPFGAGATSPETDVLRVAYCQPVSNFAQGASSNGYTDQLFGTPKIYFSTLETSAAPTTKYRLYKWNLAPSGLGDAIVDAVYQTQTQLFSKKVKVSEVRVYGKPWVSNNSFTIDLIGSAGTPITGGSKTFTAGSNLTVGSDFAWYTPEIEPTYAIGLRVTNKGTVNHVINKIEIDYSAGGK